METVVQIGAQIVPLLLVGGVFVLWVWSGVWAAQDAKKRGKPGWLIALLVLFAFWPIGLLIWVATRPENPRPPVDLAGAKAQPR